MWGVDPRSALGRSGAAPGPKCLWGGAPTTEPRPWRLQRPQPVDTQRPCAELVHDALALRLHLGEAAPDRQSELQARGLAVDDVVDPSVQHPPHEVEGLPRPRTRESFSDQPPPLTDDGGRPTDMTDEGGASQ